MGFESIKSKGGFIAIQLSESGKEASILGQRGKLRNMLSGFILLDDHLYTSTYRESEWLCLNALTGETVHSWKGGYGTISYADNRFYILFRIRNFSFRRHCIASNSDKSSIGQNSMNVFLEKP